MIYSNMHYILFFFFFQWSVQASDVLGEVICVLENEDIVSVLLYFFRFKLVAGRKKATYQTMFNLHMDQRLHLCALSYFPWLW